MPLPPFPPPAPILFHRPVWRPLVWSVEGDVGEQVLEHGVFHSTHFVVLQPLRALGEAAAKDARALEDGTAEHVSPHPLPNPTALRTSIDTATAASGRGITSESCRECALQIPVSAHHTANTSLRTSLATEHAVSTHPIRENRTRRGRLRRGEEQVWRRVVEGAEEVLPAWHSHKAILWDNLAQVAPRYLLTPFSVGTGWSPCVAEG